jgi:hypothetical protein
MWDALGRIAASKACGKWREYLHGRRDTIVLLALKACGLALTITNTASRPVHALTLDAVHDSKPFLSQ